MRISDWSSDVCSSDLVVIGIDSQRDLDGGWRVRSHTGDPNRMRTPGWRTLDWVIEAQRLGAGEIVLNCMDSDGVRCGYDIAQLRAARVVCNVPLIAYGGAGEPRHFAQAFELADVDGALAARVFQSAYVALPVSQQTAVRRG